MKKTFLAIALIFTASPSVANEGFYIGIDYADTSYSLNKFSHDNVDKTEDGVGFKAGYDFSISPQFTVGLEAEFQDLGLIVASKTNGSNVSVYGIETAYFSVNAVPKYYLGEHFYLGGKLGLAQVSYDIATASANALNGPISLGAESGSETSYVAGAGVGLQLGGLAFSTFYEVTEVKDTNIASINFGAQYNF
ncbi:outer membrane protein [Vibrio sp. LaRot3]|uniref:outer membrane protein n=1 Tax=Vibrio sp. LaRot3 TaxID=2998829 RepID=UPI0022CDD96E|nr:outer membrane beta-barrel protein [Vibrio sp. LaRot3]MDA0148214.1 outer membrane beta-barrel protein [Vibrio sp. LaRot3]